jgi:outer membrane protein OmpA-like peptidoglycan-associated protein
MKRLINIGLLSAACLAITAGTASAQELTLKVEPGVAAPATQPQDKLFKTGFDGEGKLLLSFAHYFDVGVMGGGMVLPSHREGYNEASVGFVGGTFGVRRPHDEKNTGTGFGAVSPWADADMEWVRTGIHDRFGTAYAVGASVPTGDDRALWVGPFARYEEVFQNNDPGKDNRNSKTLIFGLSFELGLPHARHQDPVPVPPPEDTTTVSTTVSPEPVPAPVVSTTETTKHLTARVQFDFDSSVMHTDDVEGLAELATALGQNFGRADARVLSIQINGYASDEGHPWAKEHNQKLSADRAQAVADYFVSKGVSRDLITVQGFGTADPVADNATEEGREKNRRVEFDVSVSITVQSTVSQEGAK